MNKEKEPKSPLLKPIDTPNKQSNDEKVVKSSSTISFLSLNEEGGMITADKNNSSNNSSTQSARYNNSKVK